MALKYDTILTQFYEFFTNFSVACCILPYTFAQL